jgi:hypothetical protein
MKSPNRFLSGANTNDRIPHRRLGMKAKGSVSTSATLACYRLPLVAQFVGDSKMRYNAQGISHFALLKLAGHEQH